MRILVSLLPASFLVFLLAPVPVAAQAPAYPPEIEGARVETYKRVGDVELRLWILSPEGHTTDDPKPAIVFFFGGGWRAGTPAQFEPQARYLAGRGMVAALADYRVSSRHDTQVRHAVADAKSAVRWLRQNAARLGIDPDRIVAAGGSAGGHLAAATATLPGYDDEGGDDVVSSRPDALVLFNPAVVLAPVPGKDDVEIPPERAASLAERLGGEPSSLSPFHHVGKGMPPTLIFHGKADTTVPYRSVEVFTAKMQELGNRCELVGYDGAEHGFFNYNRDRDAYRDTVACMDRFLVSLGFLDSAE